MDDLTNPLRKSRYSAQTGNCLEAGATAKHVIVQDTKESGRAARTTLRIAPDAWRTFTATLRDTPTVLSNNE